IWLHLDNVPHGKLHVILIAENFGDVKEGEIKKPKIIIPSKRTRQSLIKMNVQSTEVTSESSDQPMKKIVTPSKRIIRPTSMELKSSPKIIQRSDRRSKILRSKAKKLEETQQDNPVIVEDYVQVVD